ncbi:MAG TPA: hypothetical protein DHW82_10815 [Spirochaetia bacterium]|nr:MAG: hypothetical protein A2Y41_09635 [Spirochaetes bacterium GWB1_36_13]HCL57484.1 hypothetical protein [Spirochaetia bacterium]
MKNYSIDFESQKWIGSIPGLQFKEWIIEDKKVRLVEFSDSLNEEEWCQKGHLGYVLEGRAKVVFSQGIEVLFQAGDMICIPAGVKDQHKTEIKKGEKALILFFDSL